MLQGSCDLPKRQAHLPRSADHQEASIDPGVWKSVNSRLYLNCVQSVGEKWRMNTPGRIASRQELADIVEKAGRMVHAAVDSQLLAICYWENWTLAEEGRADTHGSREIHNQSSCFEVCNAGFLHSLIGSLLKISQMASRKVLEPCQRRIQPVELIKAFVSAVYELTISGAI